MFFGGARRNKPDRVTPVNPLPRYDDAVNTNSFGRDGFRVLAKADPDFQGRRPAVPGSEGKMLEGPDESWES